MISNGLRRSRPCRWGRSCNRIGFRHSSATRTRSLKTLLWASRRFARPAAILTRRHITPIIHVREHSTHRYRLGRHHVCGSAIIQSTYFVNVGDSHLRGGGHTMLDCCPCLTRSRCSSGGHWVSNLQRMLCIPEMEALQGFPPGYIKRPSIVTQRQYAAMLGNADTVSVVGRVALSLLSSVGLVDRARRRDIWHR